MTVQEKLVKGTVIALKVQGKRIRQRVIADVSLNPEHHMVTGKPGGRVIQGHMKEGRNPTGWKSSQYSLCYWPPAVALSKQPQRRMALKFPYGKGARYVWTNRKGEKAVMLLRYAVGGEHCESHAKILAQSRPSS